MLSDDAHSMANHAGWFLHHFRFYLESKAPLRMPAYNKGNVIRGGFGSTFRLAGFEERVRDRGRE